MLRSHLWVVALLTAGCGDDDRPTTVADAGRDAGATSTDAGPTGVDAGARDSGSGFDAGAGADAGGGDYDAGADAAIPDAGSDAGRDDTACDDVHAGAIFCDGFESGLTAWASATSSATGVVDTVTTPVFRGHNAMRARTLAMTSTAFARATGLGGLTSGELYFRAWVRLPAGSPVTTLYLLNAQEDASPRNGFTVGTVSARSSTATLSTASHAFTNPDTAFVRDTWQCLEVHVHIDATAGAFDMWVDGAPVFAETGWNTLPAGGYDELYVGITGVEASHPATELLFDEVVVDTTRVGCVH